MTEAMDYAPAFLHHQFLELMHPDDQAHNFVYALMAQYRGKYYHVGSACRISENLLVTAKHILEILSRHIAGVKLDMYDPDARSSPHGHNFEPPKDLDLFALQFFNQRKGYRFFKVLGAVWVGYKESDLLILDTQPFEKCMYKNDPIPKAPQLDLAVPAVGREILAYGFPDNPKYPIQACNELLTANWLYRSKGSVTALHIETGSAQFISYDTTAKVLSGMSGGPVFTMRDGTYSFCGVIGRGGDVNYSVMAPLWLVATCCSDNWPAMLEKYGFTMLAGLMKDGTIPTKNAHLLNIDYDRFVVQLDPSAETGY